MTPYSPLIRLLFGAGSLVLAVLAPPALAEEPQPPADSWRIITQGPYGFTSGGAAGSYFFRTPGTAFTGAFGLPLSKASTSRVFQP